MLRLYGGLLLAVIATLMLVSRLHGSLMEEEHLIFPQEQAYLDYLFAIAEGAPAEKLLPVAQLPLAQLQLPKDVMGLLHSGGTAVLQDEQHQYYFYRLVQRNPSLTSVVGPVFYPQPQSDTESYIWKVLPYGILAFALLLLLWPLYRDIKKLQNYCWAIGQASEPNAIALQRLTLLTSIGQTLEMMQQRLMLHRRQQRDFLNAVSHDFLTPLARMKFALASTSKTPPDECHESLQEDIVELECLIDEFLSYAELTRCEPSSLVESFSAHDVFQRSIARLKPLVKVHFYVAGNIDTIRLNRSTFERIVQNLLNNAGRYATEQVRITLEQGARLQLTIEDDGPGFPDESETTLLEAFHQGPAAKESFYKGSGLGLSTVALLCQHLNAELVLSRSQRLGGAAVSICFAALEGEVAY